MKKKLTLDSLIISAKKFCKIESKHPFKELYGVTDGKAVGTLIEHRFKDFLGSSFNYEVGNSASGIDLPSLDINTDIKEFIKAV